MNELTKYEVSKKDLAHGRRMKIGGFAAPFALALIPLVIFGFLLFAFGATPPAAATFFFLGIISAAVGFVIGLIISGILFYKHATWTREMRERIAADGIRAEEIEWFRGELKTGEKQMLGEISRKDLLLADAYRETLASRLTATRIVKSSKQELLLARRRQNKLKYLKSEKNAEFQQQIQGDIEKIGAINKEAGQMLAESETRLQMIEAAARRGANLADSEFALKKLSARTQELPLALESAKMDEEIRRELENEPLN